MIRTVTVGSTPADPLVDPVTAVEVKPVGHPAWAGPLVFSDEFSAASWGAGGRWLPRYPDGGQYLTQSLAGNLSNGHGASPSDGSADEPQIYHPSGLSVADGLLSMTLTNGVPSEHATEPWFAEFAFTSGMLCSHPRFALPGGYIEARLRCDAVAGAWPAFWALSASNGLQWPPEIDVVEYWGSAPAWAQYGGYQAGSGQIGTGGHPISGNMATWNTFGCHYIPGSSASFYCNGALSGTRNLSFADALFLVLNLAGDHRAGMGPSPAATPIIAQVDWVRAWALPA